MILPIIALIGLALMAVSPHTYDPDVAFGIGIGMTVPGALTGFRGLLR